MSSSVSATSSHRATEERQVEYRGAAKDALPHLVTLADGEEVLFAGKVIASRPWRLSSSLAVLVTGLRVVLLRGHTITEIPRGALQDLHIPWTDTYSIVLRYTKADGGQDRISLTNFGREWKSARDALMQALQSCQTGKVPTSKPSATGAPAGDLQKQVQSGPPAMPSVSQQAIGAEDARQSKEAAQPALSAQQLADQGARGTPDVSQSPEPGPLMFSMMYPADKAPRARPSATKPKDPAQLALSALFLVAGIVIFILVIRSYLVPSPMSSEYRNSWECAHGEEVLAAWPSGALQASRSAPCQTMVMKVSDKWSMGPHRGGSGHYYLQLRGQNALYIADLPYPKIYDAVKPQDTIAIQVFHDRVTLAAKNGVVEKTNNYPETGLANFSDWMWAGAACLLVSAIIFRRSLGGAKA